MTDKDEFNDVANIIVPIENPKSSRGIADIQNEEKMAHMEQELEILREELRQVRDLTKLSATTFPTFKTPIYFPKANLPSADLPNQLKLTERALLTWDRTEVIVHGELSHPIHSINSIPVTDELDGATFHTLEIMQAIRVNEEAEPEDTKLSSTTKMVASEMLKYGYQPKSGLGPKSSGIVEPIQLKHQKGTNGLRYEPALGGFHREKSDTIFVLEQALIPDQACVDDITEGIGNLFVAMAGEEGGINLNRLTIHDAELGEILQNWTTSPSVFQPESW
ncbi:hypothetical protein H5410_062020 [Solanum commersonii]|uniref:G-patch domain-containing protein n=1 Tax=Solanum commersonii TaxID=4109 RepID=A0A9J5WBD2_SOLCO|nr:hypothetical protein H5410_062020 [Solanum commersonii]